MSGDEAADAAAEHEIDVTVGRVCPYRTYVLMLELPAVCRQFDGMDVMTLIGEAVGEPPDALATWFVTPPEDEKQVVVVGIVVLGDTYGQPSPTGTRSHGVAVAR